ncbi:hypothetical protein HYS94_01910 [Candidatus Daviesbacteria bacterium]|nr:hypothetical protein [Candidatus Daviesbacteria bacterium]
MPISRSQLNQLIYKAIVQGIQRNGDRIFNQSQQTSECFVPVDTGMLKKSGYVKQLSNGVEIGYIAPYACIPYLKRQKIRLSNGAQLNLTKLRIGDLIDDGFGNSREVIAIKKQPKQKYRILEIVTESGKKILVTDNHKISMGGDDFREAKNLIIGDSIGIDDKWVNSVIECKVCHKKMKAISITHCKTHSLTQNDYKKLYGPLKNWKRIGYRSWNKGLNKFSDARIAKYAEKLIENTSFKKPEVKEKMKLNHWSKRGGKSWNIVKRVYVKCGSKECKNLVKILLTQEEYYRKHKTFCSKLCESNWRAIRYSGEGNPRFGTKCSAKGTSRGGFREDLGHYVRSSWEANFARLLKYSNISYYYEAKRFDLKDGRTYCPDFLIPSLNCYLELKGYDGDNRFEKAKQIYSQLNFIKIDGNVYKDLETMFSNVIPLWEYR